jgi:glucose-fructose oxidoreductase
MPQPAPSSVSRRTFLERAGAGLVASHVAAVTACAQTPAPSSRKIGWAVVGLGNLSNNQILPAFAKCELSKVTALVSGSPEKARKQAATFGVPEKSIYSYANFDALRDNRDVDAVYVVLPNSMHAEYSVRASRAGKHVLCEKPMANTPGECRQMIDAARQAKRKLMVAYRVRYEPYNQALIKSVREKEFGPLKVVLSEHGFNIGDPTQWRLKKAMAGGGSLMDIGIYSLNAARYVTGEEPVEVSAMLYSTPNDPRFVEVEENITFQLRFPSGVLANCVSSYGAPFNRIRAVSADGWIELEPATSYGGLRMRASTRGRPVDREHPEINHFAAQMDHLSRCVIEGTEPLTPGEDGLKDLTVMMAIYEASKSGRTVKL